MLQFNFQPFPLLSTGRLELRAFRPEDLHALFHLRSNDEILTYLDRPKQTIEQTDEVLKSMIADVENNLNISWAITVKNDPTLIGSIGFWRTNREHHRAEIGYMLFPHFWNTGIITEAMRAVLQYGLGVMNLHSIEGNVNPNNLSSIRVLEKCGFVKEAHFRENYYNDGRYYDTAVYSLLAGE
jgi:ribosomal-protein-alanine N-acetyltransferase